jgi:hypothetical protein
MVVSVQFVLIRWMCLQILQIVLPDGGNDIYVAVKQYVFILRLVLGTT